MCEYNLEWILCHGHENKLKLVFIAREFALFPVEMVCDFDASGLHRNMPANASEI